MLLNNQWTSEEIKKGNLKTHCWAYTPRKPELKETHVPTLTHIVLFYKPCGSQHTHPSHFRGH